MVSIKKDTKVINLFGGPGIGKSTAAAQLYADLKLMGKSVELVTEYVKSWAWEGRKINKYDQLYITAKQIRSEARLYGKVDYIVTDSPFFLGAFYEEMNSATGMVRPMITSFVREAVSIDHVTYFNFLLERHKPYVQAGRYESADEAIRVDSNLREFLQKGGFDFTVLTVPDNLRSKKIISLLEIE